jgi:Cu+-exporting ATPase
MDTLASFGWSLYALFFGMAGMRHSFEFTISRGDASGNIYLEERSKKRAGSALHALLDLGAKDVTVVRESPSNPGNLMAATRTEQSIPIEDLSVGGRLLVRATRVGAGTRLAQMAKLVEDAQLGKSDIQRLADRVASVFVPAVIVLALATPVALLVGTGRSAQLGILIKGPEALEQTRKVDTIVHDHLGTVPDAIRLSRRTLRVIKGNLFWAFAYNLAALPLAAFGLLNPMIAGAAMAFSSLFVVLNSLRLNSFR